MNEPGTLAQIAQVIAEHDGNIDNIRMRRQSPDFTSLTIDLEVYDLKHLTAIIAQLRAKPVVANAERVNGYVGRSDQPADARLSRRGRTRTASSPRCAKRSRADFARMGGRAQARRRSRHKLSMDMDLPQPRRFAARPECP